MKRREGVQDVSTLKEPYRIEGNKTMGYEIAEQFGWRLPDVILYPTGGGAGIIGIYKALLEMRELGWVSGPLPQLVAVQAAGGCAPIVTAFVRGARESEPFPDARTVAFGITVPKALGDFLVLDAVYATGGTAVAVTDEELLAAQRELTERGGTFASPGGSRATKTSSCSTPAPTSSTRRQCPSTSRCSRRPTRFPRGPTARFRDRGRRPPCRRRP